MGAYQKKRLAKEPGENGRLPVLKRNRLFHVQRSAFDDSQRIVIDEPVRSFLTNYGCGSITAAAEDGRPLRRTVRVRCQKMNTTMFQEDLGTFPGWNAEFAGDAHRRDLSEYAASNVSSNERRLFLDLKIAFRVNQNGMDTLKLQPVKNLVRSYRHGDLRKLH